MVSDGVFWLLEWAGTSSLVPLLSSSSGEPLLQLWPSSSSYFLLPCLLSSFFCPRFQRLMDPSSWFWVCLGLLLVFHVLWLALWEAWGRQQFLILQVGGRWQIYEQRVGKEEILVACFWFARLLLLFCCLPEFWFALGPGPEKKREKKEKISIFTWWMCINYQLWCVGGVWGWV